MQNNEILGLFWLVITIGYRYWVFKQSVPILPHRRLTFWYLLVFAYCFTAWSGNDYFPTGFGGFVGRYVYSAVRQNVKAHHLLGKEVADLLTKEHL